jgi:hypothetical protein
MEKDNSLTRFEFTEATMLVVGEVLRAERGDEELNRGHFVDAARMLNNAVNRLIKGRR